MIQEKQQNDNKNELDTLAGSSNDVGFKNEKLRIYKQLHKNIQDSLSEHIWEIISYEPLRFLVAHSQHNQIIYANIKNEVIKRRYSDRDVEYTEIIPKLEYSKIVIAAIPKEI